MQPPHSFSVEVATKVWVEKAILLHNIVFRWQKDKANDHNFHDWRWRVYNSSRAFSELFPYFKQESIKRRLKELVSDWYLVVWCYNKFKFDKTLWYSPANTILSDYWISMVCFWTMDGEEVNNGEWENEPTIPVLNPVLNPPVWNQSPNGEEANASIDDLPISQPLKEQELLDNKSPPADPEYWKADINRIIEIMKDACSEAGLQYMPWYKEREFAKHITSKKLAKEIEKYDMPLEMFIANIIKLSSQQFMKACNSPSDFYKNWWYVLNSSKKAQEGWTKVYDLN